MLREHGDLNIEKSEAFEKIDLPAYCTSLGKALLCRFSREERENFWNYTNDAAWLPKKSFWRRWPPPRVETVPEMELLHSIPISYWSKEEAKRAISEVLARQEKLDAVIVGTDHMAEGVIEELRKCKMNGKVLVVGGDGDQSAVRLIKNREQHATVFQHPTEAAKMVWNAALALANGQIESLAMERKSLVRDYPGKEILTCSVPYTFVDASNVEVLERYWADKKP